MSIFCLQIIEFEVSEVWAKQIITKFISCAPQDCSKSCSRAVLRSQASIFRRFNKLLRGTPSFRSILKSRVRKCFVCQAIFCYSLGHRLRPSYFLSLYINFNFCRLFTSPAAVRFSRSSIRRFLMRNSRHCSSSLCTERNERSLRNYLTLCFLNDVEASGSARAAAVNVCLISFSYPMIPHVNTSYISFN